MLLLQPAWLILLAPWAALVVLCLREFRPKVIVPFLGLWPSESPGESRQRFWRRPPWPVIVLLLALLTMIVALSKPTFRRHHPMLHDLTVIVDRGVTMLAGNRLQQAATDLQKACDGLLSADAVIRVVGVGEDRVTSVGGLRDAVGSSATAMQQHGELRSLATNRPGVGAVVLVSDMVDPPAGVIVCGPAGMPENVGIVSAAVNQGKCLLTLRNDSSRTSAHVRLLVAGGHSLDQEVALPERGKQKSHVLDVPSELLKVTLSEADDLEDDNVRWMLPRPCAALVLNAGLPPRVQRFSQSYAEARAGWPASRTLRLTGWQDLPESDAIVAAPVWDRMKMPQSSWPEHEVLRDVRIPAEVVAAGGEAIRKARAEGWRVLIGTADRPLLAVDDEHRRAWVGFEPANEEDVPDWLILLTNVADHLAATAHSTSEPRPLGEGWKRIEPAGRMDGVAGTRYGVYQRGEELFAVNVDAPELRQRKPGDIRSALMAHADIQSRVDLARWLWLTAAIAAAASVFGIVSQANRATAS